MRDFRKYDVWVLSHKLALEVYKITSEFPNSEKYQLTSQMQRAAFAKGVEEILIRISIDLVKLH